MASVHPTAVRAALNSRHPNSDMGNSSTAPPWCLGTAADAIVSR